MITNDTYTQGYQQVNQSSLAWLDPKFAPIQRTRKYKPDYEVFAGSEVVFAGTEDDCIAYVEEHTDFLTKEDYISLSDGFEVQGYMISEYEEPVPVPLTLEEKAKNAEDFLKGIEFVSRVLQSQKQAKEIK